MATDISALIVVRNGEAFIARAIESILAQTVAPAEIVVLDGCSTDRTREVARDYSGVRILTNERLGIAPARNAGVEACRNDVIAFLDCDDVWHPRKLERQLDALSRITSASASACYVTCLFRQRHAAWGSHRNFAALDARPVAGLTPSCLLLPRSTFEHVGPFDDTLTVGTDSDWFARAIDLGVINVMVDETLVEKTRHLDNVSTDADAMAAELAALLRTSLRRKRQSEYGPRSSQPHAGPTDSGPLETPSGVLRHGVLRHGVLRHGVLRHGLFGTAFLGTVSSAPLVAERTVPTRGSPIARVTIEEPMTSVSEPALRRTVLLAQRAVEIEIIGNDLYPMMHPAMSHLPAVPDDRPLDGRLVVRPVTSTDRPPPAIVAGVDARGLYDDGQVLATVLNGHLVSTFDRSTGEGCWRVPNQPPPWDRAAPFRQLLSWWASDRGMAFVHAASVGDERGAALLVGRGGSGKTTTALTAALAGLTYFADDYCLVEADPPAVHSTYRSAKADDASLDRLPRLRSMVHGPRDGRLDKAVLSLDDSVDIGLTSPLIAIVAPTVGTSPTCVLRPMSALAGLRAAALSTVLQLQGGQSPTFDVLSKLVRSVPCFEIDLGPDPADVVATLTTTLDAAGSAVRG